VVVAFLACGVLLAALAATASAATNGPSCERGQLRVAGGCASRAEARAEITKIVRAEMRELGLKATIVRVDTGTRPLLSKGFGRSMDGVPASPDMHFRIGSMAIPHLITLLLQLQDEGVLSLDDKLAKYRPGLPNADRITLRMLANNTSGYRDWIQGNQAFVDSLHSGAFKQWSVAELLAAAFARGPQCEPGTCFIYAHTNYAVLAQVIAEATGRSVGSLMRERIFKPLGLRQTAISRRPAMPGPVLHSYTAERGFYEDSTFWSPSWTIGAGTVMSATIGDVARTARAVGSGALISPAASRERFAPAPSGLSNFGPDLHFGLGIVVAGDWRLQNPMLNGYTGIMAYLPARQLSIAIVTTALPRGAGEERAFATLLFSPLTAYLAPGNQVTLPG
jgi:CubicO group peptidase (beta-lactamase class C family)